MGATLGVEVQGTLADKVGRRDTACRLGAEEQVLRNRTKVPFVLVHHTVKRGLVDRTDSLVRDTHHLLAGDLQVACPLQEQNPPEVPRWAEDRPLCRERPLAVHRPWAEERLPQLRQAGRAVRQRRFFLDRKGLSEELHLVDRSSDALAPCDIRALLRFSFWLEVE